MAEGEPHPWGSGSHRRPTGPEPHVWVPGLTLDCVALYQRLYLSAPPLPLRKNAGSNRPSPWGSAEDKAEPSAEDPASQITSQGLLSTRNKYSLCFPDCNTETEARSSGLLLGQGRKARGSPAKDGNGPCTPNNARL